jgi:methionyl-tRNA formyltransferase
MKKIAIDSNWFASDLHVSPRDDSPRVLFLGEGVGALTLEQLLKRRINVQKVLSGKEDPVTRLAKINNINSEVLGNKPNFIRYGLGRSIDYVVVAFTDRIISADSAVRHYKKIIGVHASSLPQYRGAYPIEAALLDDKKMTDIVTFLVTDELDGGPILMKDRFSLRQGLSTRQYGDDLASDLYQEAAYKAGILLAKTLLDIKKIKPKPQTGEPSHSKEPARWNLEVNWNTHTTEHILNMQRVTGQLYTIYKHNLIILSGLELEDGRPRKAIPQGGVYSSSDGVNRVATMDRKILRLSSAKFDAYPHGELDFNSYLACAYHLDEKPQFASPS